MINKNLDYSILSKLFFLYFLLFTENTFVFLVYIMYVFFLIFTICTSYPSQNKGVDFHHYIYQFKLIFPSLSFLSAHLRRQENNIGFSMLQKTKVLPLKSKHPCGSAISNFQLKMLGYHQLPSDRLNRCTCSKNFE